MVNAPACGVFARRIRCAVLLISVILVARGSFAQDRGVGLGAIIGEPTGLSVKVWTSDEHALDFGLGWSVGTNWFGTLHGHDERGRRLHFHMDHLWHAFSAIHSNQRFPLYYGVGARVNTGAGYDGSLAFRGVIGVVWLPLDTVADFFVEVAPSFELLPESAFGLDAGLGVRYYP
jgi:hypothetical protein